MRVVEYSANMNKVWNDFVAKARNATFLINRAYMDYHADRFCDCSLLVYKNKKLIALLPASLHDDTVISHGGLTYGGFLLSENCHIEDVGKAFESILEYYRGKGYKRLIVKPIPYIYQSYPCDDQLYWLFRHNASLIARGVSSTIDLSRPLPFSTLRNRKVSKAISASYTVNYSNSFTDFDEYWKVLETTLMAQHRRQPVHTLEEILLLKGRFCDEIQLVTVRTSKGNVVAGTVLYVMNHVIHAQYIAASEEGKQNGALDLMFSRLIENFRGKKAYFDFGISTEDSGRILNEGLAFQKEGFGARSVVYDAYCVDL